MNIGAGSRLEGPVLRFGEKMENRLPAADCRKHECRRPALRAAFRCTDRLLAAHDAFEREWTEASAAVWKIHGVFRAGRCRFALLFFSLFSPEQQENQGRRRILDCVSGVSLREKCQSLMHTGARRENLVAANFGRILQSGLFGVAAPISDAFAHAFCRRPPEVEDGQPPVFGCVGAKCRSAEEGTKG